MLAVVMFGSFKRVSDSEQQMIDKLAIEVLELIEDLPEELISFMPEKQRKGSQNTKQLAEMY